MQLICQMARFVGGLYDARLEKLQPVLQFLRQRRFGGQAAHVDSQRSELLADLIVQLARNAAALLFLGSEKAGGEGSDLFGVGLGGFFESSAFGNVTHERDREFSLSRFDRA